MRAPIAWIVTLSCLAAPSFAADEAFFQEAARGGMAEVALGQLGASKGSSEGVKAFGRQMVVEHGSANAKLQAAAAKSGVKLPTDLPADALATKQKLESLSGQAFDQAYVESQSQHHTSTIALLEKEIESGTDAAAKAWAREALPMVKRHAELVTGVDAKPGEQTGEHTLEHAVGTPGPAKTPPAPATPH